jgi:hypothetical protein
LSSGWAPQLCSTWALVSPAVCCSWPMLAEPCAEPVLALHDGRGRDHRGCSCLVLFRRHALTKLAELHQVVPGTSRPRWHQTQ